MDKYDEIKNKAFEANLSLPRLGLVLFTFGNVSAVDRAAGVFAIKPSGVPYSSLREDMMVIVDFEGILVEGTYSPSSDTKTHACLYKHWVEIGGIAHTHSSYATSWAQSQRPIPLYGTTHADHCVSDIPCAPPMRDEHITGNYELETGFQIIEALAEQQLSYLEMEMILVANHAPFTWGKTAEKAVYNSAVLEELAKLAYLTESINVNAPRMKDALINKHYERKHGKNSYYGQ